jgi:hypothetical protein
VRFVDVTPQALHDSTERTTEGRPTNMRPLTRTNEMPIVALVGVGVLPFAGGHGSEAAPRLLVAAH